MKTVIITGANGNLGTATVKKFLDEGYRVVGVDSASNHLDFALKHANFEIQTVNLGEESESEKFVNDLISKHGKVEAALLLVGGFAAGGIAETTGSDLKKMFTLNFETAFYTARPLFQHMIKQDYGRLVFVGARPALVAEQGKGLMAYGLSKSLLFKFAEYLNAEARGKNVVASVIVPSTIDTSINRKSMPDVNPDIWVKAEQIADVLEFICSEKGLPLRDPVYKIYNNA